MVSPRFTNPDVVEALTTLREQGWVVEILSNHVPELDSIVDGLGLGSLIDQVFSSAIIGYEKPNPESFRIALAGESAADCFMVGDNLETDVLGAERIGLPAILVRTVGPQASLTAPDLIAVTKIIRRQ
jgi:putative hydrolase of the HAD superfamily